jgi:effector-binding domain-containing protein
MVNDRIERAKGERIVTHPVDLDVELVAVPAVTTAVIKGAVATDHLAAFFDDSFGVLGAVLAHQRVASTGPAFALYQGPVNETAVLEVGFPTDRAIEPEGSAEASTLPAGRVARVVHAGSFDTLGGTWQRLEAWINHQGLTPTEVFWEVYLTEPSPDMDPADLRTELSWLLAGD